MATVAAPKKKPKLTDLSRPATKLVVWMGNDVGHAPDKRDRVEFLKALRWERVAGGGRMNTAVLEYDLSIDSERVLDTLTPKAVNRQVEIREMDALGKYKRVLAWGKLAAQPIEINSDREAVQYVVRIDKHHFGQPLGKVPFWTPRSGGEVIELDRPLIFNPEIDEQVKANRSNKTWTGRDDSFVWFDAAAVNTAAARTIHDQVPAKWKIFEAVHALLWLLNPDEDFITNLTLAECRTQLQAVDASHDRLQNVQLEPGKYLPQLLDDLLERFGCSWTVDLDATADGPCEKKFRFFQRNEGTKRELFLQRPGSTLDPVKSTVPNLAMNFDIANLANRIIGCTSRKQREGTFELYKCWPASEDDLDKGDLEKEPTVALAHPHAGHKWVLNESGAWAGLRPEITLWTDLTSHFDGDDTLPTCRKFLPCLSRVVDAGSDTLESRGIYVEWYDSDLATYPDVAGWQKVTWSFSVLQHECGIWFETIPGPLWNLINDDPATARIRVTATIEGDTRNYATAERADQSPNADDITLRINLGDKFHDRKVAASSRFIGSVSSADEINDTIRLQAYVEATRGLEDAAELSCSAVLEGLDHPEYQIGDLIKKVNGRNLLLSRNNRTPGVTPRYLQIMGITHTVSPQDGQRMELLMESFDEEQSL